MRQFIFIFLLFNSFNIKCQSQLDTIFYDINWNRTSILDSTGFYGFKNYDESKKGMATYYYATGEIYSHQNEIADKKNGYCIWYYKSGGKSNEGNYINDKPNGEQVWYYENGVIKQTGVFNESDETNKFYYDLTKGQVKDSLVIISQPEIIDLYRGYKNKIEIGFRTECEFKIGVTCTNCDTVYNIEGNKFVIVPGPSRNTFIEVYKEINNDKFELISRTEYRVKSLPDPTIYFGGADEGKPIYWNAKKMYALYPSEIYLNYTFDISHWVITIGKKHYSGTGNGITSEVQKGIKKLREGKKIELTVTVIDENNKERVIATYFKRAPNEWYKDIEN